MGGGGYDRRSCPVPTLDVPDRKIGSKWLINGLAISPIYSGLVITYILINGVFLGVIILINGVFLGGIILINGVFLRVISH